MGKKRVRSEKSTKMLEHIGAIVLISVVLFVQILFITMKSSGVIDWGWFYVCLPVVILGGLYLVCTLIDLICLGFGKLRSKIIPEKVVRSRKN